MVLLLFVGLRVTHARADSTVSATPKTAVHGCKLYRVRSLESERARQRGKRTERGLVPRIRLFTALPYFVVRLDDCCFAALLLLILLLLLLLRYTADCLLEGLEDHSRSR